MRQRSGNDDKEQKPRKVNSVKNQERSKTQRPEKGLLDLDIGRFLRFACEGFQTFLSITITRYLT